MANMAGAVPNPRLISATPRTGDETNVEASRAVPAPAPARPRVHPRERRLGTPR